MPGGTLAKKRAPDSVGYNQFALIDFAPITLAAGTPNTTVQAVYPLPVAMKIYRAAISVTGTVGGSLTGFNIVAGTGAETGTGTPEQFDYNGNYNLAVAGQQLFPSDTLATAITVTNTAQVLTVPGTAQAAAQNYYDVIWPQGTLLTVRVVTAALTTGTLQVVLLAAPYDIHPSAPGTTALNPTTDF